MHIIEPVPVENPLVNYIVLGLSFLFEGSSWMVALREFRRSKGKLGYIQAVRLSKDPASTPCCSRTAPRLPAW